MDKQRPTMAELIERSSFGTPAAKKLRERTPAPVVERILARVRELEGERE